MIGSKRCAYLCLSDLLCLMSSVSQEMVKREDYVKTGKVKDCHEHAPVEVQFQMVLKNLSKIKPVAVLQHFIVAKSITN